jgi:hypothetical protein
MRKMLLVLALASLAGCTAVQMPPSPASQAPRGSEAFCRYYGDETTKRRVMDSGSVGHGPSGFDRHLAARAGDRAYQRCLSGRTG